eukprot:Sdes_comp19220_c0_seq1m10113
MVTKLASQSEKPLSKLFACCDCVCFDVDSTVCQDEGIDLLASTCGVQAQVSQLTSQAMGGDVSFEEALKKRLDLIQPSRKSFETCLKEHPPRLTPGIEKFVHKLLESGIQVFLVSGGFRLMIEPVAEMLGLCKSHIYANTIHFDEEGNYLDFDRSEPTCRTGGKAKVVNLLAEKFKFKEIIMIGDGITDMEARPPARLFIGFGGNVVREQVRQGADLFVYQFDELMS